jgi:hypothetical protein
MGAFRKTMPAITGQLALKKQVASSTVIEGIFMEAACFVAPFENSKNIVSSEGSYLGMFESSGIRESDNGTPRSAATHPNDAASELTQPYQCPAKLDAGDKR